MPQSTQLTVYCPQCGTSGFRLLRSVDNGIIDPRKSDVVQRHMPVPLIPLTVRMVCPNPQCSHEYSPR